MSTGPLRIVLLSLIALALACGSDKPILDMDAADDGGEDLEDGGFLDTDTEEWAYWPPRQGSAGLTLFWTVNGEPPTGQSCDQTDFGSVRFQFLHPFVDFETWTDERLEKSCPASEIVIPLSGGFSEGRYRYEILLFHLDGTPFAHSAQGETVLRAGAIETVAALNVTSAEGENTLEFLLH